MGEATIFGKSLDNTLIISIHASRGGSDRQRKILRKRHRHFNPRFPWGKRLALQNPTSSRIGFQSTLPVGEATRSFSSVAPLWIFQSTLPVGEATRGRYRRRGGRNNFNPRFPWGKRPRCCAAAMRLRIFQSTLPVGEATTCGQKLPPEQIISIHASRGGSDAISARGPRHWQSFQSTLPVGEATSPLRPLSSSRSHFNPRFPWGKRRRMGLSPPGSGAFQSTLPVGEATLGLGTSRPCPTNFNPRFPWGKRPNREMSGQSGCNFNPRFPWGKRRISGRRMNMPRKFQSTLPVGEAT